jgi:hypothetical protein
MAERESPYLWSTTALTNGTVDGSINFAEGQLPSTVNNSTRALMAALARLRDDAIEWTSTGGSANGYTLTISGTQTAYASGQTYVVKANHSNTGASTLNVTNADATAIGAKAIRVMTAAGESDLRANMMRSGGIYLLKYDTALNSAAGGFLLLNPTPEVREVLIASRTYYVRTDGSDSNTGLVDSAGGAFLTIQKALDTVGGLDFSIYDVTIDLGNGTYSTASGNTLKSYVGAGSVIIVGDTATPSNVVVTTTGSSPVNFLASNVVGTYKLRGFQVTSSGSAARGIHSTVGSYVEIESVDFGSGFDIQLRASDFGRLLVTGNYSISGGANWHITLVSGFMRCQSRTVTLTGTPAWAASFIDVSFNGTAVVNGNTYSGAATGTRYAVTANGVINTGGAGASYFPGNAAGSTATGGQYI